MNSDGLQMNQSSLLMAINRELFQLEINPITQMQLWAVSFCRMS